MLCLCLVDWCGDEGTESILAPVGAVHCLGRPLQGLTSLTQTQTVQRGEPHTAGFPSTC